MLGNGGCGETKEFRDLADAQLSTLQRQENSYPVRVRQRLRDGHELAHVIVTFRQTTK